jgi:hypothetical protein
MPALNVEFTEEEMAQLRSHTQAAGSSLKAYVHDTALREAQRAAFVEGAVKIARELRPRFEEAFPEGLR